MRNLFRLCTKVEYVMSLRVILIENCIEKCFEVLRLDDVSITFIFSFFFPLMSPEVSGETKKTKLTNFSLKFDDTFTWNS